MYSKHGKSLTNLLGYQVVDHFQIYKISVKQIERSEWEREREIERQRVRQKRLAANIMHNFNTCSAGIYVCKYTQSIHDDAYAYFGYWKCWKFDCNEFICSVWMDINLMFQQFDRKRLSLNVYDWYYVVSLFRSLGLNENFAAVKSDKYKFVWRDFFLTKDPSLHKRYRFRIVFVVIAFLIWFMIETHQRF